MLQSIRDKVHGWIAWVFVIIIGGGFVLIGMQYYIHNTGATGKAVAKVNGVKITAQQVSQQYQVMVRKYDIAPTTKQQALLKKAALNQLIGRYAARDALNKMGFVAPKQFLLESIAFQKAFRVNGHFSPERMQQVLASNGITEQEFFAEQTQLISSQQLQFGIANSAFATPKMVSHGYAVSNQTRDYSYIMVPLKHFASIKPTTAQVQQFYQKHQAAFTVPAKVKLQYLEIDPKVLMAKVHVTTADARTYFEGNKQNYMTSTNWKVLALFFPNAKPTDKTVAAAVAKLEAGTPMTAMKGVKTQTVSTGEISPAYLKALKAMKPGQVSVPFKTKLGVRIVQLVKKQPGHLRSFASVKKHIVQTLKQQKAQKTFSSLSDKLSNLTYTHPNSLVAAAKATGLKLQTTGWISQGEAGKGIAANPQVLQTAFSTQVMNQGVNSNLIGFKDGRVVVIRVTKQQASYVKPLKAVRAEATKMKASLLRHTKVKALAKTMQKELKAGKTLAAVAAQYKLKVQTKVGQTRGLPGSKNSVLNSAVFMETQTGTKHANTLQMGNGDNVVFVINKIQLADPSAASSIQKQVMAGKIPMYNGQSVMQLLDAGIVSQAKVVREKTH